mmetsp:Transcript_4930/g.14301  ORF Transcript_4930/g.14301 Transcript_4930/m.14301 type:complete len:119 (+) Transcript_4930:108-464(+)
MGSLFSCLFVQSFLVSINMGWAATEQLEALFRPVHPQLCVRSTLLDLSLHSIAWNEQNGTEQNSKKTDARRNCSIAYAFEDAQCPARDASQPANQPTSPVLCCVAIRCESTARTVPCR